MSGHKARIGALIALVALAAFIGAMLPKTHRATRSARFRQPPEAVYAVLAVLPLSLDHRGRKIAFDLVEDRPPTRRVTRIADPNLPFGGAWTLDIAPAPGGGAAVPITEDGEIHNVIFRFVARYFMGYTSTIDSYLRDLGQKLGEPVRLEA